MADYNWDKVGIDITKVRGGKTFCPKCHDTRKDKKDRSLSVNKITGLYNCHYPSCDFRGCVADKPQYQKKKDFVRPPERLTKVSQGVIDFFEKRKISNNTLLRMKVTESKEWMPQHQKEVHVICFNYYQDEKLVNIKFRTKDKKFKMVSGAELIPYNIDAAKGETELNWNEGEGDCLATIECGIFNVVSVPNGASGADAKLEYIDNCWEQIEHIEKHIIAVDDDAAGRLLRDALVYRFGAEKCWFVKYPDEMVVPEIHGEGEGRVEILRTCKDMNEVLVYFGPEKVREIYASAFQPPVAGVYYTEDVAEDIFDIYANGRVVGETTHYDEFDKIFRWKRGDINLVIGQGNYGKTICWLDKMLIKSIYDGWRWAIFCPENYPATDFYIDVIEMYVGKHIDDRMGNKMSGDELYEALDFFNKHFIYVYPDEVHSLDNIHTIFRSLILRHGIDGVLIDPWNQLDHIIDSREDLYLSKALKEIKKFALQNRVSYNIIAHPKGMLPNKDGELPKVKVWNIAGGPMWNNKCDQILVVDRPEWHSNKTSTWVSVETHKVKRRRTGGSLGECDFDYLLKQSRFCCKLTGEVVCDPKAALIGKKKKEVDYEAQDMWKGVVADGDAPF